MTEFELIRQYFANSKVNHSETVLGVGDDAAVVDIPDGYQLVTSVDSMLENVHFPATTPAQNIGRKLAAVNISDIAAMGGRARWATLAISMPSYNQIWLEAFSKGLSEMFAKYDIELIGGDTTQGPLSLSLQIMGLVESGQAITRSGAKTDHNIYVSGTLGDAAIGLQHALNKPFKYLLNKDFLIKKLEQPTPRTELGAKLVGVASSCIDISDGLLSELTHISRASNVGIEINLDQIPLSEQYKQYLEQGGDYQFALTGGDDYELCFTAPLEKHDQIMQLANTCGISVSQIGQTTNTQELCLKMNGEPVELDQYQFGYQHFNQK